jgi:glycerol-3-phosphate O-acyltransferase/dihydroxyacetone phosphate acyltransferase
LHPLLYLTYHLLKSIVRVTLRIFYRKTVVVGRDRLSTKGPLILLSNHPSTVMDPFNVVARSKREVYFLANASLFKHPLASWILSTLYCIRVERNQDVDGRPLRNEKAFAHSIRFLADQGCLYVAPEGTSEVERRLRKVKTGTARIALAAEAAHGFQLGVQVLPVGLNYSDPTAFRSNVVVEAGELIRVADFKDLYEQDEWEGVRALTIAIRDGLREKIVHTENEEEDSALRAMEGVAETQFPVRLQHRPARSRGLLEHLRHNPTQQSDLRTYDQFLSRNVVSDEAVAGQPIKKGRWWLFLWGLPLAVFGLINHLLPCGIPWLLNDRLNRWPCYDATYKYVSGLVIFPLFYILQIKWIFNWTSWGWVYLFLLPLSGWWADHSWDTWKQWRAREKWHSLDSAFPAITRRIREIRMEIAALVSDVYTPQS